MLDRVELEISPSEILGLVGESGAGKSTIALLLLGLAMPSAGRITIGGVDLALVDTVAWRQQIAWVPQRPTLLSDTIAANIRMGYEAAPVAEVERAARQAAAEDFILELPDGYRTAIGEGGRSLSAGERRRIALARAFLRDAPLVDPG